MGAESFGPYPRDLSWRRRGPTAEPFALDAPPPDLPIKPEGEPAPPPAVPAPTAEAEPGVSGAAAAVAVDVTATPVSRAVPVAFEDALPPTPDEAVEVTIGYPPLPPDEAEAAVVFVPPAVEPYVPPPLALPFEPEPEPPPPAGEPDVEALWAEPVRPEEPEVFPPVRIAPPAPEDVPAPSPFKPDPVPGVATGRRGRARGGGFAIEATVPYLAAIVALVALGGAIWLDRQAQERSAALAADVAAARADLERALTRLEGAASARPAPSDGTVEALLALQERIAALEAAAAAAPAAAAPDPPAPGSTTSVATPGAAARGPVKTQLLDAPTTDCIPLDTRFVMTAGDAYPICRTPEVIKVTEVTLDGIVLSTGKAVPAGSSSALRFGACAVEVLTTDMNGFAELQVHCS